MAESGPTPLQQVFFAFGAPVMLVVGVGVVDLREVLRCPKCGKSMIGTRATGRNKTYRYVLEPCPLRRQQVRLQAPRRR